MRDSHNAKLKIGLTFCIIAYKDSPFLQRCIDSLKNQTKNAEICICTSTPSAYLRRIAKTNKISLYINSHPGKANDWNFAYRHAKTRFVTLAHHDDEYHSNYAETLLSLFQKYPTAVIAFTDYSELFVTARMIIEKRNSLNLIIKRVILETVYLLRACIFGEFEKKAILAFGDTISCPTVMFNKALIPGFSFLPNLPVNLDWEAWLDLAAQDGGFIYSRKKLLKHVIHADSHTTKAITGNARLKEDQIIFNRIWPKAIAGVISRLYSLSYSGNFVNEKI